MEQSGFIQLKTIPIYTKTLVMLSAMNDDKITAIIKSTAQYFIGGVSPVMDDPLSQMLVNEMCECIDKAEENRVKKSRAGKKGMEKRYNPDTDTTESQDTYSDDTTELQDTYNSDTTQLQDTYNSDTTQLQDTYNYTYTKTNTNTKTKNNKNTDILPISPDGEIGLSEKISDPPENQPAKVPKVFSEIRDMYNNICISLPKVRTVSEVRVKAVKARLKMYDADAFRTLFEKAEDSDFLKGANNRNWVADFDWLIKDSNMAKVLDGKYDNDRLSNGQKTTSVFSEQMKVLEEYRQRFLAEEMAESNDQI